MATATKSQPRTAADFPELDAANQKRAELLQRVDDLQKKLDEPKVSSAQARANVLLGGVAGGHIPRVELQRELLAARSALSTQSAICRQLQFKVQAEVSQDYVGEHVALLKELGEKIVATHRAFNAVREHSERVSRAGGSAGHLPGLNFSQFPRLPGALAAHPDAVRKFTRDNANIVKSKGRG